MSTRWRIAQADETTALHLAQSLQIPQAVAMLLVARGVRDTTLAEKFFKKSMADLVNPFELPGMQQAAERLSKAVCEGEKILIHGDFDADGITSTALLTAFFRELKCDVTPFVPNRLIEGHGISPRAIELAQKIGIKVVVTCDCGTSSAREIDTLSSMLIETIVTDHHAIPEELPAGAIVVNPKLEDSNGGHEDLSGVGVAFMLTVAVRSHLRDSGYFATRDEPNLKTFLDIVALGTLADMASLRGQNRILVSHGLRQLSMTTRPGIVAMRETAGLTSAAMIRSADVGFRLAPRINAAARLGHSEEALQMLLTQDASEAAKLAKMLEDWNQERKELQERMFRIALQEAEAQVQEGRRSIVVAARDFHSGIIGLVAQKLASHFFAPVFVFAVEGDLSKGSARSRGGFNIVKAMGKCSDLLEGFGGHEEAGGCTMKTKNLSEFRSRFESALLEQKVAAVHEVLIDAELNLRHLNEGVLNTLEDIAPFGIGNPEPAFMARAKLVGVPREVGSGHVKLVLSDEKGGGRFGAIGFGLWKSGFSARMDLVEVVYTPEFNDFQGRREIQLRLQHVRSV